MAINVKDRLFKTPSIKKRYVYTPLVYGGILKGLIRAFICQYHPE